LLARKEALIAADPALASMLPERVDELADDALRELLEAMEHRSR
jgi:hypothetical protein